MGSRSSRKGRTAETEPAVAVPETVDTVGLVAEAPEAPAVPEEFPITIDEWQGRQPGYARYLHAAFRAYLRSTGRLARRFAPSKWTEIYESFRKGAR